MPRPTTIEEAPALEIDRKIARIRGDRLTPQGNARLSQSQRMERRIVWTLLRMLEASGWKPVQEFFDPGEEVELRSKEDAMEIAFNLDFARVKFENNGEEAWVLLVMGNGVDLVSDYTMNLDELLADFDPDAWA